MLAISFDTRGYLAGSGATILLYQFQLLDSGMLNGIFVLHIAFKRAIRQHFSQVAANRSAVASEAIELCLITEHCVCQHFREIGLA